MEWMSSIDLFLIDSPPDGKRGTGGVFHKTFAEKVKDAIKNPGNANDKHLKFYVKKNQFKLLDFPSLDARDVLVVPVKRE